MRSVAPSPLTCRTQHRARPRRRPLSRTPPCGAEGAGAGDPRMGHSWGESTEKRPQQSPFTSPQYFSGASAASRAVYSRAACTRCARRVCGEGGRRARRGCARVRGRVCVFRCARCSSSRLLCPARLCPASGTRWTASTIGSRMAAPATPGAPRWNNPGETSIHVWWQPAPGLTAQVLEVREGSRRELSRCGEEGG
jgi:hypothetical protein